MKKHLSTIVVIVIFICGLSLFLYPALSNMYNEHLNNKLINDYKDAFSDIKPQEYNDALEKARLYNENLNDKQKLQELGLTYENTLNITNDGIMGYIEIPKISVSLVIYHTIDENVLQKGIGHVPESALPVGGKDTHCLLAGHTGLPSAKLLTNIDHLKIGDKFYIHVLNDVLEYRIDNVSVVEPHEVSLTGVVSGKDCVTLITCTPYGVNSHRLLVRGTRVNDSSNLTPDNDNVSNEILNIETKYLITFSLLGLGIVCFAIFKFLSIKKKKALLTKEGSKDSDKTTE